MPLEKRVILVVVDGLGDRVVRRSKTVLGLADKPILDELASAGSTGLMSKNRLLVKTLVRKSVKISEIGLIGPPKRDE